MRTATCVLFLALSTTALADDKPVKWEYAELSHRSGPVVKGKGDNEATTVEYVTTIRWTTGSDDMSAKAWDEMAEKLKVQLKKESSVTSQKIQVLNALGASGWELVDQQATTPTAPGFGNPGGFGQPGVKRGGNPGGFGQPGAGGGFGMTTTTTTMLFKRRAP